MVHKDKDNIKRQRDMLMTHDLYLGTHQYPIFHEFATRAKLITVVLLTTCGARYYIVDVIS